MSEPAIADDQPFQHYTWRHRVEAWVSQKVFDQFTYTVRRGLLKGMRRKGGLGWIPTSLISERPSPEEKFWKELDLRDQVVFDIGSFHGLLAMYFSRSARQVVCFEPSPRNYCRLTENVNLNKLTNVICRRIGLGAVAQRCVLTSSPLMPGGGSVEAEISDGIQCRYTTSVQEEIEIRTLDEQIFDSGLPAPDFVKIDVEGCEASVLKGAERTLRTWHPVLFLEMHGETLNEKRRKVAEIIEILLDAGYRQIEHIETHTIIDSSNSSVAAEGHLYARVANCPVPA